MRAYDYRLIAWYGIGGVAFLMLAEMAQASRKPFEHYAPILDRRPFGVAAPPVEVAAPEPATRPDFTRHLRLVALRDGAAGVRVGLVDTSARPPQSYYLSLGATEDELTVVDVDFEGGRALVRKAGRQDWISMRQEAGTEPAPAVAGAAAGAAAETVRQSTAAGQSYAERRRQRLEAMRSRVREPESASEPAPDPAELDRQLQEYQMNLIRSGRTPLPIPLSEEADAQLVAEGVLPPLSER